MKPKLLSLIFLAFALNLAAFAQQPEAVQVPNKTNDKASDATKTPPAKQDKAPAPPAVDSDEDLRRAIQSSGGSENLIITNFEAYLVKYPKSAHRAEIENEIYKLSVKLHDRNRAISYAEKMVASDPNNLEALTSLVTSLRERRAPGDLNKALEFAGKLVKQFETFINNSAKPKRISAAQWQNRKDQGLASVYLLRGKVQTDLGNDDKALSDLQKSFKIAHLAGAAITLGDLADKRKSADEAIDYYSQAFVIALVTNEELDLKAVRRKLGQIYAAKHGSEKGLGDRVLKAHDDFTHQREERLAKLEPANINEGLTDPMKFKLSKLDGSMLDLSSLRGKVIVLNFWATWCGPCLTEMPMFEKTAVKYKDDKSVVFLAVDTDEDRELVAPFLKEHKFTLPVVFADYLDNLFSISSIPTTIILDPKGQVSFRQSGFNPGEDFVAGLSEKIEAAKKK